MRLIAAWSAKEDSTDLILEAAGAMEVVLDGVQAPIIKIARTRMQRLFVFLSSSILEKIGDYS